MFKVGLRVVASRYAKALALSKEVERLYQEFSVVVSFLKKPEVFFFFTNPSLPWWIKVNVWQKVARESGVSEEIKRFSSLISILL